MLGIILIYWIGRKFYDLATRHDKSQWGWAIAGVAIYYLAQFVFAIIFYGAAPEMAANNEMLLNILGIVVGGIIWYAALNYLEKKWEAESYDNDESLVTSIEEIGKDLKDI
ncbi:MAG: hypothetical protein U5M51_07020 [Emticicia sp.]|nr:hypothetical protein [Emticicia sp.]